MGVRGNPLLPQFFGGGFAADPPPAGPWGGPSAPGFVPGVIKRAEPSQSSREGAPCAFFISGWGLKRLQRAFAQLRAFPSLGVSPPRCTWFGRAGGVPGMLLAVEQGKGKKRGQRDSGSAAAPAGSTVGQTPRALGAFGDQLSPAVPGTPVHPSASLPWGASPHGVAPPHPPVPAEVPSPNYAGCAWGEGEGGGGRAEGRSNPKFLTARFESAPACCDRPLPLPRLRPPGCARSPLLPACSPLPGLAAPARPGVPASGGAVCGGHGRRRSWLRCWPRDLKARRPPLRFRLGPCWGGLVWRGVPCSSRCPQCGHCAIVPSSAEKRPLLGALR